MFCFGFWIVFSIIIIKLPFWFNTRPENCKEEVLKMLKEVGAYRISFGIECGNEEFRTKVFQRNPTVPGMA